MKTIVLLLPLLFGTLLYAQQDYELLFLKGEYYTILNKSQKLETHEDYYWNSIIRDKHGKTLEAIELLEFGIIKFDSISILEILLSDFLYKTGQYSKAKPFLAKHIDNPQNFLKYINILEYQEKYQLAIELLQRELLKDSSNLDYQAHLGDNYYQIDSLNLAIKVYSRLLTINPNDQIIALKLANFLIKNKDYSKAVEICDVGLSSDSTNKKLIKLKGMASFNQRDFKTAELCFSILNEKGDSTKFTLKHLGISEFKNDSFTSSRKHLLHAFRLDSNDSEICFILGKGFLNSPYPEKGLYYFDRVDSMLQPDPKILSALYSEKQSIYSSINNYEMALQCYQKAYDYDPKPEFIFYIASLHQNKLNNPKGALEYYERFLSLLPKVPDNPNSSLTKEQVVITLKSVAERNIILLKEDLFFEGKLE